jgi:hypothetical protein
MSLVAEDFSLRRNDKDKYNARYMKSLNLKVAATSFHNLGERLLTYQLVRRVAKLFHVEQFRRMLAEGDIKIGKEPRDFAHFVA